MQPHIPLQLLLSIIKQAQRLPFSPTIFAEALTGSTPWDQASKSTGEPTRRILGKGLTAWRSRAWRVITSRCCGRHVLPDTSSPGIWLTTTQYYLDPETKGTVTTTKDLWSGDQEWTWMDLPQISDFSEGTMARISVWREVYIRGPSRDQEKPRDV